MNFTYIHTRVLNNSGHAATMLRDLSQKNYDCILSYLLMAASSTHQTRAWIRTPDIGTLEKADPKFLTSVKQNTIQFFVD